MIRIYSIILLLFIINFTYAQPSRYGKVSKEDFNISLKDTSLSAFIIFDYGTINIKGHHADSEDPGCPITSSCFNQTYKRHVRFRILSDTSFTYSLYLGDNRRGKKDLTMFKAILIENSPGAKPKKKYNLKSLVDNYLGDESIEVVFKISDITRDCIIDLTYGYNSDTPENEIYWAFNSPLYTLFSEIIISRPELFNYHSLLSNKNEIKKEYQSYSDHFIVTHTKKNGWRVVEYSYSQVVEIYSFDNNNQDYQDHEQILLSYYLSGIDYSKAFRR